MKHRIFSLFFLAGFLFTTAASSILPFIPAPTASAATPGANFTLNYPDNDEFKGDIRAAAKDGGIGPDDIRDVLSKTAMYTKGGRLGTVQLKLSEDFTDKNSIPTYSVQYYCYPTEEGPGGYKLDTSAPNYSKPFVRYVMGVTLEEDSDWEGLASNGPYTTHVGVLGNTEVGTIHFPKRVKNSGDGNVAAKDFKILGKDSVNGHDLRTDVENHLKIDDIQTSFEDAFGDDYSFKAYDSSLPGADKTRDVLRKCMPSNKGDLGKVTSFMPKDTGNNWTKALEDAKIDPAAVGGSSTGAGDDSSQIACKVDGLSLNPADMVENVLNWLFCGFVQGLSGIINTLDNMLNDLLSVGSPGNQGEPSQIFGGNNGADCRAGDTCSAYYQAWESFRNIALGLMLIAGLIVLIAQALGMELLDAYTIRKILPRLLIAALAITLSWQLMQFAVEFTNDVGYGIRRLIYAPFDSLNAGINVTLGESFGLAIVSGIGLSFAGLFGLLSLVGTAALAVFVAFLVLILREIAIIMLIIMAPVGIVAYILPNTQRVFKLWWESFSKALLMFPLIAALIAAGRVFSAIAIAQDGTINKLIGFFAYFAPYFIIPMTFQLAGGFVRQLGGFVNDRSQGIGGALRNFRGNQIKQNTAALKAGTRYQGKTWIPGSEKAAKGFGEATKGLGSGWNGRFGFGERGRLERANIDQRAAEEAGQGPGMKAVSGWNDVTRILAEGMGSETTGREALRRHLERGGDDGKFGADMSDAQKKAAIDAKVEQAAAAAKVAGGFTKANGIAGFMAMARDGTAIKDTDDLARLSAVAGQGNKNNTFKYAAEAASISRQVGRPELAAASEPIGELAFAYSDLQFNTGMSGHGTDDLSKVQAAMPSLSAEAWKSGAGGEVAYTKFSNSKGRAVRNDTRKAVDILKNHRTAVMEGRQSIYSEDQVKFAAASLMDAQNAIDNNYGKLNNREDAQTEMAKDEGALNWYLDTPTTVEEEVIVASHPDDGTARSGTPIQSTTTRQTTNREVVKKMVGDRLASMTPEERAAAQQGQKPKDEQP